jgi:hypothetical protein
MINDSMLSVTSVLSLAQPALTSTPPNIPLTADITGGRDAGSPMRRDRR